MGDRAFLEEKRSLLDLDELVHNGVCDKLNSTAMSGNRAEVSSDLSPLEDELADPVRAIDAWITEF
jgi:hypothetical protein